jgi:predicted nucleic acid-binding protein
MAENRRAILLDANLLLLVAIGKFDKSLIGRKRLDGYTHRDFDLLRALVDPFTRNLTTPHLLTEISNLADHSLAKNQHHRFRKFLAEEIFSNLDEHWISAKELSQTNEFHQLGLADAAICRLADERIRVLSVDAALCNVLWGRGVDVRNFNHLRNL